MPPEPTGGPGAPPGRPLAERLLDASLDAIYAVDPGGLVRTWNWGAEQMYGFGPDEAVGRSVYQLMVPFDRREEFGRMARECQETGSAISESLRRRRDGTALQVQVVMRDMSQPRDPAPWLAVGEKDITEQKRFEQMLSEQVWSLTGVQAFLQSILDGTRDHSLVAVDMQGRIEEWNAGARRDFGYASEEVKGQSCEPLLLAPGESDTAAVKAAFQSALAEGRCDGEFLAVRKDGTRFPARTTINLRRGPYNDPVGYVVVMRDITEDKKAETARRVAQERLVEIRKLEEVNRLKTSLLNTASHELNTPLTPLQLQAHLLATGGLGELNERQQNAADLLRRNIGRLSDVVHAMLEVARIESGGFVVTRTPLELSTILAQVQTAFGPVFAQKKIKFQAHVRAPLRVFADGERVEHVIRNLLDNAAKFTPEGGRVRLEAELRDGAAHVRVADTGVGLSVEQKQKLFRPFGQAHDSMQITRSGSGLSLYIARAIVEAHGGRIDCASEGPSQGATFEFSLPTEPAAGP